MLEVSRREIIEYGSDSAYVDEQGTHLRTTTGVRNEVA